MVKQSAGLFGGTPIRRFIGYPKYIDIRSAKKKPTSLNCKEIDFFVNWSIFVFIDKYNIKLGEPYHK